MKYNFTVTPKPDGSVDVSGTAYRYELAAWYGCSEKVLSSRMKNAGLYFPRVRLLSAAQIGQIIKELRLPTVTVRDIE